MLVFTIVLCGLCHGAEDAWLQVATPHFSLLTPSKDPKARDLLAILERFRAVLLQTEWKDAVPTNPVQLVVCKGETEFQQYREIQGSFAFYVRRAGHDFIVVKALTARTRMAVQHEYMHAVLRHIGGTLPLWLEEGIAQVYSSAIWRDTQVLIGAELEKRPSLSNLEEILSIHSGTSGYPEPGRMAEFYSTSWAVAHMLLLDPKYRSAFPAFLREMSQRKSPAEALSETYGLDFSTLTLRLKAYLSTDTLPILSLQAPASSQDTTAMSIGSSEVELETTRSYLRVNTPVLLADSERRLRKLYERFPQSVDIAECLAFVVSFADRPQEALQYFTAALANGSHNSEIVLLYVRLARAQGVPPETVLEMLSRALRSNPTNQELLFLLGQLAVEAGDYSTAVQAMTSIQCSGSVQRQYVRFYTLAYCSLKQNKPDLTREYASLAKTYATTNEDVRRANNLARLGEFESKGSKVHVFDPKLIIRTN